METGKRELTRAEERTRMMAVEDLSMHTSGWRKKSYKEQA